MISKVGYQPAVTLTRTGTANAAAPLFRGEETKPTEAPADKVETSAAKAKKPPMNRSEKIASVLGATATGGMALGGLTEMNVPDWPNFVLFPFYALGVLVPGYIGAALARLGVKKAEEKKEG